MKNFKDFKNLVQELEKNYDFANNPSEYLNEKEYLEHDNSIQYLELLNSDSEITNEEIIYCADAIKYLSLNDPSLKSSLDIACELNYTIDKIGSELLASLLKTRKNEEDWIEFLKEVNDSIN